MGWASEAVKALSEGRTAKVRPLGGSMRGRIESGQLVTLAPVRSDQVKIGDAVLVRWKGNYLLHLIKQINGDQFLIGNNVGKINGWAAGADILGIVTKIEN